MTDAHRLMVNVIAYYPVGSSRKAPPMGETVLHCDGR